MDPDDLGAEYDRMIWAPHLLKRVRKRPTDAIREAREARLCGEGAGQPHAEPAMRATRSLPLHLSPTRAPWCREQDYRRGAVSFAGHALPRGERWLRAALLVGGSVLVVRIVLGLVLR